MARQRAENTVGDTLQPDDNTAWLDSLVEEEEQIRDDVVTKVIPPYHMYSTCLCFSYRVVSKPG